MPGSWSMLFPDQASVGYEGPWGPWCAEREHPASVKSSSILAQGETDGTLATAGTHW